MNSLSAIGTSSTIQEKLEKSLAEAVGSQKIAMPDASRIANVLPVVAGLVSGKFPADAIFKLDLNFGGGDSELHLSLSVKVA